VGFREPLTSVPGLDTGPYSSAGVRIYEDNSAGYPRGVVEFYSGVDPSAFLTASPFLVQQPGGGYTSAGSSTKLTGVDDHGTTAPRLQLDVREAQTGGYRGVAQLTADELQLPAAVYGPMRTRVLLSSLVTYGAGFVDYDVMTPGSAYGKAELFVDAAGRCRIDGVLGCTAALAAGAAATIFTGLPAQYRPKRNQIFAQAVGGNTFARVDISPTGTSQVVNTGGAIASGQYLSLNVSWLPASLGS
jgi:hypothetical protein